MISKRQFDSHRSIQRQDKEYASFPPQVEAYLKESPFLTPFASNIVASLEDDERGRIVGLDLSRVDNLDAIIPHLVRLPHLSRLTIQRLCGPLPESIVHLSQLTELHINTMPMTNDATVTIPAEIGTLHKLEGLSLKCTNETEPNRQLECVMLPETIIHLKNLRSLSLQSTTVPAGTAALPRKSLSVIHCAIETIASLNQLVTVQKLHIDLVDCDQDIFSSLDQLNALKELSVSVETPQGPLCPKIGTLSNLETLCIKMRTSGKSQTRLKSLKIFAS